MSAVTATTFTAVGEEGLFVDTEILRKRGRNHRVRLGALVQAPASGSIDVELAYHHDDGRLIQLPNTRIARSAASASDYPLRKMLGNWTEVTKYVNRNEPLVLRVTARVSTGTGNVLMPTVMVESG